MNTRAFEVNFDGLVGNTHNYAGLSYGNLASSSNQAQASNPQEAALQGLKKMHFLSELGVKQAVLPPQERPDLDVLRKLGFKGNEKEILTKASLTHPELLACTSSASSMWTANSATVSPSADTHDGKVHFTVANLNNKFHRSIEPAQTARTLKAIFNSEKYFAHHEPLCPGPYLGDEGAANHTRFCEDYGSAGLEYFVFGRYGMRNQADEPQLYPARQSFEASQAVVRLHGLSQDQVIFMQQNPVAVDAGVFHNDVASVGNKNFFFCHEQAFLDQKNGLEKLKKVYEKINAGATLHIHEVLQAKISLSDAVRSYLFNTQLISKSDQGMVLIAPKECEEVPAVKNYLQEILAKKSTPITQMHFLDLKQSMRNGGGPACLRLRVVLTEEEIASTQAGVFFTSTLFAQLTTWVKKHYRDRLTPADLADPQLLEENRRSLDELTQLLGLGSIYRFQI